MERTIIINVEHRETRLAMLDNKQLVEFHVEQKKAVSAVGSVYYGKVINIVPAIQAAFIDMGLEKHGFLHVGDLRLPDVDIDRNTKIQQVLSKGQPVLVQVQKDPIATKGFKLTMDVSLAGRYTVLMPRSESAGVSRSIQDRRERERLRSISKEAKVSGLGVIIRTVAEGKPKAEVARDLRYLVRLWKTIQQRVRQSSDPHLVYHAPDLVEKTLRDAYKQSDTRIILDDESCRERIIRFLSLYYPRHEFIDEILLYKEAEPIFRHHNLDRELERAFKRRVDLESGGFLLMEESETLTAIDVNSGRLTRTSGPEETAIRTNMEAAAEITRQPRLRDIGGMIIIDFIPMGTKKQRNRVYNSLKRVLNRDRSRTKLSYFSDLELVQITRQRVRESLEQQMTEPCTHCNGQGRLFSRETLASQILRELRELLFAQYPTVVKIWLHPEVHHLLVEDHTYIRDLGKQTGSSIVFIPDPSKPLDRYQIKPEGIPLVLAAPAASRALRSDIAKQFGKEFQKALSKEERKKLDQAESEAVQKTGTRTSAPQSADGWGDERLEREAKRAQQRADRQAQQQAEKQAQQRAEEQAQQRAEEQAQQQAEKQARQRAAKRAPRDGGSKAKEERKGKSPEKPGDVEKGKKPASQSRRRSSRGRRGKQPEQSTAKKAAETRKQKAPENGSAQLTEQKPRPSRKKRGNHQSSEPKGKSQAAEKKKSFTNGLQAPMPEPGKALSFRPEPKGSRLRFSSRRDLKNGFGDKYEIWAQAAKEPSKKQDVEPTPEAPGALPENQAKAPKNGKQPATKRRKPRSRSRSSRRPARPRKNAANNGAPKSVQSS